MEKISLNAIADQVGVSTATVSRVLNNREGIGTRTRKRVLEAARASGYRPRVAARPVTVALVMDSVGEPSTAVGFVHALALQALRALARHQIVVETFTAGNLSALTERFVDGVLAIAWRPESIAVLDRMENVPVAIFNRPEYPRFSNIQIDDHAVGHMAASHLLEHGHRALGIIAVNLDDETRHRVEGMRDAAATYGLQIPDTAVGLTHHLSPYSTLQRLYREGITGLLISSEHLTEEIPFLCCEAMGLEVPSQLSVIGMNIEGAMRYHRPPMTLISPPVQAMADAAADLLDRLVSEGHHQAETVVLRPTLTVRDSVTGPASR